MKKSLFIVILCILSFGVLFSSMQVFAAAEGDLYYYNGDKLYFDMHSLYFVESSSNGADIRFGSSNYFNGVNGASIKEMGAVNYMTAKAPAIGYTSERVYYKEGNTYAVRCGDGSYGIIKITSVDINGCSCEFMARSAEPEKELTLYYLDADRNMFNLGTMENVETPSKSDVYFNVNRMTIKGENGTSIKDLSSSDYDSAKAPLYGYTTDDVKVAIGHVYAVRCGSEGYYVIKVTNVVDESSFEFMAREAIKESDVPSEPAAVPGQSSSPTVVPQQPSSEQNIKTNIEELFWVENGTRFVMGGKIIFEDSNEILCPYLSPDKRYVVYSNGSDNLIMYDIIGKSSKTIYELEGLDNQVNYRVYPVGWSQDGGQVAFRTSYIGGFIGGNQLCILNLSDKKVSVVAKGLSSADWGKNGMFAIANGKDVWLVDQLGRNKVTLTVPTASAFFGADNVSFTPDSSKVIYIVADKYYFHDINTNTYEELSIPENAASNGTVRAGKDGRIAVIEDRKIYIYNTATKDYSLLYQDADSAYPGWIGKTDSSDQQNTAVNPVPPVSAIEAVHTSSSVLVNGRKVAFDAYNIGGHNFFKLRDVAMAVTGSGKQFEVTWDGTRNAINLISNRAYTPNGSELAVSADLGSKNATLTTSKIYLNSIEVKLTAYNINGSNYFMLRDIGKVINFNVTWDGQNNTILIDTGTDYKG